MSANVTFTEPWSGTLSQLEWPATPRLLLLAFINVPLLSIVLNILWQLVSSMLSSFATLRRSSNA